jgi:complement component 1 Q subcomponent-binding protein
MAFPMRLMVTITKPNAGVLHIQTLAQDGFIQVEDVHYFKDASLADAKSAEQELKRRDLYAGPPFENLDVDLQMLLERYLEERGINSALATFVPDLAELKEQREYVVWLGSKSKLFYRMWKGDANMFAQMLRNSSTLRLSFPLPSDGRNAT